MGVPPASTAAPAPLADSVRFGRDGRFLFQPRERRLLVDGSPAALGARAFDMLVALAERAGRLVTKHELLDLVWPGLVVEENNLAAQISSLRKVLGADVIATVPGRGYRFVPDVAEAPADADAAAPDLPASAPSPAALRTNLPATMTPLVGRNDDLAALHALVDQHRLVVIVGAGGMGKTLLAQHLLARRVERYTHGVCWIEMAGASDAQALPALVAGALGVRIDHGAPLDALAAAVSPLDLLVVLDNAEQLLDGVAALAQRLLDAAPMLTIIVTSQVPLRLASERVFRIDALSVPNGPLPLEEALAFGAVALFAERARQADARHALSEQTVAGVIEICRALDGLPLAIELAAARAPALGISRIAGTMQERLRFLTASRNRAAPARQQTLRAALDWSHELLVERDRVALRRLSATVGSFDVALAQRVVADGAIDEWEALDALASLVERSFVAVVPGDDDSTRYRMLDSPRAYARERLEAAGEVAEVERRHGEAMVERLAEGARRLGSNAASRRRLEQDIDNARAAVAWARAAGSEEAALLSATGLLRVLSRVNADERRTLVRDIASRTRPDLPAELRVLAWGAVSEATSNERVQESLGYALQAEAAAREGGDPRLLEWTLRLSIAPLGNVGEFEAARSKLDEMRSLLRADGPDARDREFDLLFVEAGLMTNEGDAHGSLAANRRLAALAEQGAVPDFRIATNLIDAAVAAGQWDEAIREARALLQVLERSRDTYRVSFVRLNLCSALCARGDHAEARDLAERGWPDAVRFGHDAWWADYLARIAAAENRPRAAALIAGWSDATYRHREDSRQPNEAAALATARAVSRDALGAGEAARLEAEGAALETAQLASIAFARSDAP